MKFLKITSAVVLLTAFFFPFTAFAACVPPDIGSTGDADSGNSRDPNSLTGPAGYGPQHYIKADSIIPYRIDFENDTAALVPAQQVDISNQLEDGLEPSSFQLTEIGFGDHFIPVPPGTTSFETVVPMTCNEVNFEVRINAGIDVNTGVVSAHFYSIDPETGWPPPVEIGFLPPEDETGRGMGHVSYIIRHKTDLVENSEIRNIALIVFDMGEEIYTNQIDPHDPGQGTDPDLEAPVTIDQGRPVSTMTALPEKTATSTFTVSWGGSDSGSGIAGYNIYTREGDELDWQLWQQRTTATSAEFTGLPEHTHEFYSVAIDNVGFIEQKVPVPDTKTIVSLPAIENEPVVTAHLSALASRDKDLRVSLNASRSSCYIMTDSGSSAWPPGCSFTFAYPGATLVAGSGDTILIEYGAAGNYETGVTACANDDPDTDTDESTICDNDTAPVTARIVEPEETTAVLALTDNGDNTCTVSGTPGNAVCAYVYWGNRRSTQVIDTLDFINGVSDTCDPAGVSVKLYDENHIVTIIDF